MAEDNFLSTILESIETLKLSEGDYLEACNLMKECYKRKEKWESSSKSFEKKFGANVYNKKGLCISFILTKIVVWNPKNNDKEFCKKPDDIYTMKISSKGFERTVSKKQFELLDFIESLLSLYSVTHYDILMEDIVTVSEEIYEFLKDAKCHSRKIEKLNIDEDEDEDDEIEDIYMDEDNFYKHTAFDIKKIFSFAANL